MNTAFFKSIETIFLLYKEKHGEEQALAFFREFFATRLKAVYDSMGFEKGKPEDFKRVVEENDKNLGLPVEIILEGNKIIYRFLEDPFPGLRGQVDAEKWDSCFMDFKISHILGDWSRKVTKHLWKGDPYTEHVIEKSS
ncbi:MAG: hypothetical protein ISS93_00980 [Candidatus Aenigmarchaeota archaeon]|nr:hypothetical protein [Candidatus Aenigmarchaeota archaeon]